MKTIVFSDVHLVSKISRAKMLSALLFREDYERIIILGDLFDHGNFNRMKKRDWNLLGVLRKLSKIKEIIWIEGNHDENIIDIVSHMIGARVIRPKEFYSMMANGKKYIFMHGHQFDSIIAERPTLTFSATLLFDIIQRIDKKDLRFSRWIKRKSKMFMKVCKVNKIRAIKFAQDNNADVIVCGHTHLHEEETIENVTYINTGSWVDLPSTYLIVSEEGHELVEYHYDIDEEYETEEYQEIAS